MENKNTPLMFEISMIQAYRRGEKEQTRRTRGLEVLNQDPDIWEFNTWLVNKNKDLLFSFTSKISGNELQIKSPYGMTGDFLLFRECFSIPYSFKKIPKDPVPVWYWADGEPTWGDWSRPKPSMFMPNWAARHNPQILSIRLERLQTITLSDSKAEGVGDEKFQDWYEDAQTIGLPPGAHIQDERDLYIDLWNKINGKKYPWDKNPWVWRIVFEKYEGGKL